ncbi:bifunctional metallophosphatase/5'-nucleotidase [Ktedonobacter robiniae]|uniref:Multifunctional 2',3'-cyclic-nucleotide 2'-phosphodiesterase/5'-nucleotidase/3'-nucleotidase n=1 Tax=Ktedonobacter robiniae TaxID=2778365 RepID=A0ABQ3UN01_9CHLR|nr:bifunctional UDP-sugar hydrolase/5'-nucleotidase [Ktedonobacter robiniae]GHO54073.1 multifunctional 2',3'-cyclic-nucleotide 2'-phosphodiesterase/5'-nucleotidase/3'-nucleotidase [Ktedonobacter robiniae]
MSTNQSFRIVHSNDIHGRIDGLARMVTLVKQLRAEYAPFPVLYLDGGDVEDSSVRLSNLTKGRAMHQLLHVAGCDAAAVGNGGILHYGYQVLPAYRAASCFPQLLANLRLPDGSIPPGGQATALLQVGAIHLGIIGLSENLHQFYTTLYGMQERSPVPLVRELATQLRQEGADCVILLSHMGLGNDRMLAEQLQDEIPLIIGAHTHDVLMGGEHVGDVFIVQTGAYAQYLGCLDLHWDGSRLQIKQVQMLPITEALPPAPEIYAEVTRIEEEMAQTQSEEMREILAELAEPLTFAEDRECGTANLMADMLRARMNADVAVITSGAAFSAPLDAGPLTRERLYEVCSSPANPGVVTMTGVQLSTMIAYGVNPETAARRPRPFHGQVQGFLHLSGATIEKGTILVAGAPLHLSKTYRVAGSDWELGPYGGYAKPEWNLHPTYEMPTILREALADYLRNQKTPITLLMGRLGSLRD